MLVEYPLGDKCTCGVLGQFKADLSISNIISCAWGFQSIPRKSFQSTPLRWRHNDHAGVSNHQPHGCLLNRLFRRKSKKTSKLRVTGLCAGNSPGPVNSPHKGPVTRRMFPFDDVIMPYYLPRPEFRLGHVQVITSIVFLMVQLLIHVQMLTVVLSAWMSNGLVMTPFCPMPVWLFIQSSHTQLMITRFIHVGSFVNTLLTTRH